MKWWHYIGEFFLFNWLFNVFGHSGEEHGVRNTSNYSHDEMDNNCYGQDACSYHSYDDFLDEQEDYDMMDDL